MHALRLMCDKFVTADYVVAVTIHPFKAHRDIAASRLITPLCPGSSSFVALMRGLDLPYPRKIDFAVSGNEA